MRCDDARALIGAELDGEATPGQAEQAADHLQGCADCRAWRADVVRLDSLFAAPVEVTPLDPAAVAALSAAGAGLAAGVGAGPAPVAAATAPAVPGPRRGGSRALLAAGAVLATALVAGTAVGLMSGGGDDRTPITLPSALESRTPDTAAPTSESPSASPSASLSPSVSVSPSTSPSASRSASPKASPSARPSLSPAATMAPQPLTATARAGVLDLELHIADSRPDDTISVRLRIVNHTDRAVTFRSPSCRKLTLYVDGELVLPKQTPGCAEEYETYTLPPGGADQLTAEFTTSPGEHRVEGAFEGEDPEPTPGPDGSKPSRGPTNVQNAKAGPVVVRVR